MSREFTHLQPIAVEAADQLRDELRSYDPDTMLFDGLTAAHSLRYVVNAPKILGPPRVVSPPSQAYRGGIRIEDSITTVDSIVVNEARKRGRGVVAAAGSIFFQ